MSGGYFSNDPLVLLSLMKSTFLSAGLDPFRNVGSDGWAIDAATQTIQKLLEIERTEFHRKEHVLTLEEALHEDQSVHAGVFSQEDDSSSSENDIDAEEDEVSKDESEIVSDSETVSLNIEESLGILESKRDFVNKNTRIQLENSEYEDETNAERDELWSPASSAGEAQESSKEST